MAVDAAIRRELEYRNGRTPTSDDVNVALMKVLDGTYPYWEEREAQAILDAARAKNIPIPRASSAAEIRRRHGQ